MLCPTFNDPIVDIKYKRYKHEEIHKVLCEIYVIRAVAVVVPYNTNTILRIEKLYKDIAYIHQYDYPYIP